MTRRVGSAEAFERAAAAVDRMARYLTVAQRAQPGSLRRRMAFRLADSIAPDVVAAAGRGVAISRGKATLCPVFYKSGVQVYRLAPRWDFDAEERDHFESRAVAAVAAWIQGEAWPDERQLAAEAVAFVLGEPPEAAAPVLDRIRRARPPAPRSMAELEDLVVELAGPAPGKPR